MRKPSPRPLAFAGVVAVTAAACGGSVEAQTLTASMAINMSIAQAASATASTMNWGSIAPVPGGTALLGTDGVVSGAGVLGTSQGTAGVVSLARNVAMTATLGTPTTASISCGTSTVALNTFQAAAGTTSCATAATTACSWNVGVSATFPSGNVTTGACTAASVTMTVTYGP